MSRNYLELAWSFSFVFSRLLSSVTIAAGTLLNLVVLLDVGCHRESNEEPCVCHRIIEQLRLEETSKVI